MNQDENNERDWPLVVVTIIIGAALLVFVAYALFVLSHMRNPTHNAIVKSAHTIHFTTTEKNK